MCALIVKVLLVCSLIVEVTFTITSAGAGSTGRDSWRTSTRLTALSKATHRILVQRVGLVAGRTFDRTSPAGLGTDLVRFGGPGLGAGRRALAHPPCLVEYLLSDAV